MQTKQRTPWWAVAVALFASVGPMAVLTAVLAATHSLAAVLAAAALLVALFVAGGLVLYARTAGSLRAVQGGTIVGLVLAVLSYNLLAIPIAYVLVAVLSPG